MKKHCYNCDKNKLLKEFYNDKSRKGGKSSRCKKCDDEKWKNYYYNPKVKKRLKKYYKKRRSKLTIKKRKLYDFVNNLSRSYKVSENELWTMWADQNGLCVTCNRVLETKQGGYALDHCHKSLKVRGILCSNCNLALGLCYDSIEILENLINYLRKN